jgi:RND superfamily putative drug exporter
LAPASRRTSSGGGRTLPPLLAAAAALVALALPALDMRLGFADAGTDAPSKTTRKAYDLLAEGFGPGFNGPLIIVVEGNESAAARAQQVLASTPGVAAVTPPQMLPDGQAGTLLAFPTSSPQDEATSALAQRLRNEVLPSIAADTSATYLVGGATAAADDFAGAVSDRLPLFILVVVGLSALLLTAVFRSVLIPLKAAILNVLSIGASLGIITVVFQQGGSEPSRDRSRRSCRC